MSVCIRSKTSVALLAPNLLIFVYFPFMQLTHISKSVKSSESRIPSDTSCSSFRLEICPNLLCHQKAEFLLDNLRFRLRVVTCNDSLNEATVSSKYRLS